MKVHKITGMSKLQAWNAYREYRKALGKSGDQNDKAVMEGYKAMARGKTVIDLIATMKESGINQYHQLPNLAIIRADITTCWCKRFSDGKSIFCGDESDFKSIWTGSYKTNTRGMVQLPKKTFPEFNWQENDKEGTAIVPTIPPKYRPPDSMITKYYILWEAEWKRIPKDPMLLKPLGKNLYAVVAYWNLTPLERAVLRAK